MGCCAGSSQQTAGGAKQVVAMPKPLAIYGCISNIQYRTLLACFKKGEKNIKQIHVDTMEGDHKKESFL